MTEKSILSDKKFLIGISFLSAVFNLILLYYFKYSITGLGLSNFSLLNTGNILNLVLFLILIAGLMMHLIFNPKCSNQIYSMLVGFLSVNILVLAAALIIGRAGKYSVEQGMILQYPVFKVLSASLLIINQSVIIYSAMALWKSYFRSDKILFVKAAGTTIVVLFLLLGLSFISTVYSRSYSDPPQTDGYDIAVILGAAVWHNDQPSPIFAARIKKGYELYKKGTAKRIQLTGGKAPGEITEAVSAFNYLKTIGNIDESRVFIETHTTTTSEQVKFIKNSLNQFSYITVVTDRFHLNRVFEIAKYFQIKIYGVPSDYPLSGKKMLYLTLRESVGLLFFWLFAI